ncbi:hypothetical protein CmeUKMEL1_02340 [Cryptosporidium meleagridis]|uniref:Integral membrane protein n=1 Tax=Cryptosporidium meleagridis TaxID=93969 RepID=A0A2P4YX85_9CRYT|nr:hypothetical protein CmeUKMEL1_02340 [Cryptosporidium meleagridis]
MIRFFKYLLLVHTFFNSLNATYGKIRLNGYNATNDYLLEIVNEYVKNYEKKIININKYLILQKINRLKTNETNLINGINIANSSINNENLELSNSLKEINSYDINDIEYFKKQYFEFLKEIDNDIETNNLILNNSKIKHKERILQFFRSDINETKFQAQQRHSSNLNYDQENNINAYPIQNNYYRNNVNSLINSQQNNAIKQPALSGLLSVTNPAFKMIVSTVLMCLGSTPYGAIAVLVVVTVYTLIEVVIKYFFNKTKNKNILNTIKRSSNMNMHSNNSTNNLVASTGKTFNNKLRNLMKKDNEISKSIKNLVSNSVKINYENDLEQKKLDFFVKYFLEYILINQALNIKKKGFLGEDITKKMSGRFMNSLLDFFIDKTETESIQESETLNKLIEEDLSHLNYQEKSRYDVPDWYKHICIIYASLKEKNRMLFEGENDDWVPVNNVLKTNNEYLSELNNGIAEIDKILNTETKYNSSLKDIPNFNETIDNNIVMEMKKNENNIFKDQNDLLGPHNNTENKWYDRMIKYSIQSYRQNGIRGVITMILDIFSTIFSATPIGYLLITLIRLIAFMTDKLLLLSRRRKNQHQLTRLLLEIPEIFNEDKLSVTLKEISFIENECIKQEKILINLYISLVKHLKNFNPAINLITLDNQVKKFVDFIKNKNIFIIEYLSNRRNSEYKYSSVLRSLLYQKKHFDTNYSEGWTLNEKSEHEIFEPTSKESNENKHEKNVEITSKVIKETKYIENSKESTSIAKNSFQNMIGGLKSFLLNLFKSIFGGAGELWEYIKGLLSRIIDFIKTLWDLVRGEKKKRMLIEILEEMPSDSVVHSYLFADIFNILKDR